MAPLMAPKKSSQSTLTKAESLLVLVAARLDTAFRYKEANPGGDFSHFAGKIDEEMQRIKDICERYGPTPPLIIHRAHPVIVAVTREWKRAVKERRPPNFGTITGEYVDKCCAKAASDYPGWPTILYSTDLSQHAAEQTPELQWWLPHPDGDGRDASPSPSPPTLRRSTRTTKGKVLLPVLPLDIKIGVDRPRGAKRSAAVAALIDEAPNGDQGGDSEPGPRPIGRLTTRVRFQSPPESRPKQRRRVGDDLKTTEAAPDEPWVAVGEERCNPCKLVEREVCKPHLNATEPCKSCEFCTGGTWTCNPPDSWLEKVATMLHPKEARPKTHEVTTDDAPVDVGGSSETAEAAHPTTEVGVVKHQSGHQKGGKVVQVALTDDARLLRIESTIERMWEELAAIERYREGLAAIERDQQEITGANGDVESEDEEPSREAASQINNNGGLKRARSDELMDTSTISGYVPCESCARNKVRCAPRIGTKPPYLCARCQDANCPCVRSTPAPARGRGKGGAGGRKCAAQPPRPALPATGPATRFMGSIDLSKADSAHTILFWTAELGRASAASEAADAYTKFVQEQYAQALERVAAPDLSMAGGPRAKRAKINTSGKGKR